MRFFNTAGPMIPQKHYCIPPLERLDLPRVLSLIEQWKYFVLHAPRQTGKTTCLRALMDHLNAAGSCRALYVNIEQAQADREDVAAGIRSVVESIAYAAELRLADSSAVSLARDAVSNVAPTSMLHRFLNQWCARHPGPTVLMLDEVDALVGDTLISLLRQVRAGYADRPVIELKILHKSLERTIADGIQQTAAYMDRCGAEEGHLMVFDRTPDKLWEEKLFRREERVGSRVINVWGL